MTLHQCCRKAQDIGFDKAKFMALFPCGPTECKWLDAYMELFTIDRPGLDKGFVTVNQIDAEYPELFCSEPFL